MLGVIEEKTVDLAQCRFGRTFAKQKHTSEPHGSLDKAFGNDKDDLIQQFRVSFDIDTLRPYIDEFVIQHTMNR